MNSPCKLDLAFDPAPLRADLARIAPGEWIGHYNGGDFVGHWAGLPLRAVAGGRSPLYADPSPGATFADTPALARLPALRAAVAEFRCPLRAVRLLNLGPGSRIREHRDPGLGLDDGEARIHVPILTNPGVEFVLDHRRVAMNPGEAWYLDLSRPHRVANRGTTDRVHLVLDCLADDWLRDRLAAGAPAPADEPPEVPALATGPDAFERFRELVLRDPDLQLWLFESADPEAFAGLVVREGRARGYRFAAEEVQAALNAGRRAWIEGNLR